MSLPALAASDLRPIGAGTAAARAPLAVLGAGTGLGVSGLLVAHDGTYLPVISEGGHASLAASDDLEAAVIERLRHRFGHASAERALSGPGLVNLYEAVSAVSGQPVRALHSADVIDLARAGSDAACAAALELFCGFLGGVAGNLALTLGARGGVYIGGGIAPRIVPELAQSRFRERFENKGRMRDYLAPIPTWVIDAAISPALIGAGRALDDAR